MIKLIALYRTPEDPEAFDEHYRSVHTPLAEQMPGLRNMEITRMKPLSPHTKSSYYLMAEMTFDDEEALQIALQSDAGKASAKDLQGFAQGLVELYIGTSESQKMENGAERKS